MRRPLYNWRIISTSVASGLGAKPWAAEAQLRSVTRYLNRAGWNGAEATFAAESVIHVKWTETFTPTVLIVVVGRDPIAHGDGWNVACELRAATERKISSEYVCIANTDFAAIVNDLVASSDAEVIVLLNSSSSPTDDWLRELIGPLQNSAIAAVGGQLENQTGFLIEGGWVFPDSSPVAIYRGQPIHYGGIFAAAWCCRNHLGVSGSLMAVNRHYWDEVGGFSISPAWQRYDLDLGIKICGRTKGRIMHNTYARAKSAANAVFSLPAQSASKTSLLFSRSSRTEILISIPRSSLKVRGARPCAPWHHCITLIT